MPPAMRFLYSGSTTFPAADPPAPMTVDSDVVVILAALLCALICVVGLALVARCAWLRRSLGAAHPLPPNKGLKKKALRSLPKTLYNGTVTANGRLAECPICLTEFVQGEEIRILPQCGHGFHVSCVDMWLRSHSSCPSCRQILFSAAPSLCCRCGILSVAGGDVPQAAASSAPVAESEVNAREDGGANRFLP